MKYPKLKSFASIGTTKIKAKKPTLTTRKLTVIKAQNHRGLIITPNITTTQYLSSFLLSTKRRTDTKDTLAARKFENTVSGYTISVYLNVSSREQSFK